MNNIEIFQAENGAIELRGDSSLETLWASLEQIAKLFSRDKSGISRHIKNIYESEELSKEGTVAIFATVQIEGEREVKRGIDYYNLDMILSIGYRVDSREATQFRKWASSILKQYLINGYAINEKKLTQTKELLNNLKMTISFLSTKEIGHEREILTLLKTYTKTLTLLENYDKNNLADISGNFQNYHLEYQEVKLVLAELKKELTKKEEASQLFANEKADELSGIVANLYQTFGGQELYPTVEDKATHLLYFIIKDHPFNDGNKRSAAFLFIYFLDKCDYLYKSNGEKKINENALVTLTLLIASSNPNEKEILVKLIKHLIFEEQL